MSVYTTKKGQQGDLVLHINGQQSICPYVQALPMQGQYGQINIMRLPCTSSCPHVTLKEEEWVISCGGSDKAMKIEEDGSIESTPSSSPLIIV